MDILMFQQCWQHYRPKCLHYTMFIPCSTISFHVSITDMVAALWCSQPGRDSSNSITTVAAHHIYNIKKSCFFLKKGKSKKNNYVRCFPIPFHIQEEDSVSENTINATLKINTSTQCEHKLNIIFTRKTFITQLYLVTLYYIYILSLDFSGISLYIFQHAILYIIWHNIDIDNTSIKKKALQNV